MQLFLRLLQASQHSMCLRSVLGKPMRIARQGPHLILQSVPYIVLSVTTVP